MHGACVCPSSFRASSRRWPSKSRYAPEVPSWGNTTRGSIIPSSRTEDRTFWYLALLLRLSFTCFRGRRSVTATTSPCDSNASRTVLPMLHLHLNLDSLRQIGRQGVKALGT